MAVSKQVADAYKNHFGTDVIGDTVETPALPSGSAEAIISPSKIGAEALQSTKKTVDAPAAPSTPVKKDSFKTPSFSEITKNAYAPSGSADYNPKEGIGYDYTKQSKLLTDTQLQDAIRKQEIKDTGSYNYSGAPSEPTKALTTESKSRAKKIQDAIDQSDMLQRKINFEARQKNLGVTALDEAASHVGTSKFTDATGVNYLNPLFYLAKLADAHVTAGKALAQGAVSAVGNLGASIDLNAGDNIVGDFGESVSDYAKIIKQKFPQLNPSKNIGSWEDPEFYVKGVAEMVPNLLGGMASVMVGAAIGTAATVNPVGAIAGGIAGGVSFGYAMESGNIYDDLVTRGYSPSSAESWSKGYGAIAALPEAFFHIRGIGSAIVHPMMEEVIKKGVQAELKQTLFTGAKELVKKGVKKSGGAVIEGSTEALQQLAQNTITKFYDKNQSLFDGLPESFVFGGGSAHLVESVQNMSRGDIKKEIVMAVQNEKAITQAVKVAEQLQETYPESKDISDIAIKAQEQLQDAKVQRQILEKEYTDGTKVDVVNTPEFTLSVGETVDGKFIGNADLNTESTSDVLQDPTKYETRSDAEIGVSSLVVDFLAEKIQTEQLSEQDIATLDNVNNTLAKIITQPNPQRMVRENRDVMLLARDTKDYAKFESTVLKNNLLPEGTDIAQFYERSNSKEGDYVTAREAKSIVDKYAKDIGVTTEFVEKITTPQGKKALGSFLRDERVIKFVTKAQESTPDVEVTTAYHELGHAYFQTMMTPYERGTVLQEIKDASEKEMTDKQAEEVLVEDLRKYNDKKTLKELKKKIQPAYARMLDSIKNIVDKVLKWVGSSPESKVNKFYEDVLSMKRPSEKMAMESAGKEEVYRETPEDLSKEALKYDTVEKFIEEIFSSPSYGMGHRPAWEGMPPAHNLLEGGMLPSDVYDKPDFSIGNGYIRRGEKAANESWDALKKLRNKPNADVTIYRASPKNELHIGDWVTLSKEYAHGESLSEGTTVHSFNVKAKDVIFAGDDINEFGYYPKQMLIDTYNKAHEKEYKKEYENFISGNESFRESPSSLEEEALKYNTVEEFIESQQGGTYKIAHEAPTRLDGESSNSADNIVGVYPEDIYSSNGARYYGDGSTFDQESISIIHSLRNRPQAKVTIYRAVPGTKTNQEMIDYYESQKKMILKNGRIPDAKFAEKFGLKNKSEYYDFISNEISRLQYLPENTVNVVKINPGDWVTINRKYAVEHGEHSLGGNYKIIKKTVRADDIFTDGNSIHEWGYDPKVGGLLNYEQLTEIYNKAHGESFRESPDLYHGTTKKIVGDLQFPLYTTTNKEYASVFARSTSASSIAKQGIQTEINSKILDLKLSPTAKILDIKNPEYRKLLEDEYFGKYSVSDKLYVGEKGNIDWTEGQSLSEWIYETGKDFNVVILDEGNGIDQYGNVVNKGESYMILNEDALLQESFRENITDNTASWVPDALPEKAKKSLEDSIHEVLVEMEIAEAGFRYTYIDDQGFTAFDGVGSSFPKWFRPDNRTRPLLNRAAGYLDGQFRVPPAHMTRLRSVVQDMYEEVSKKSDGAITMEQIQGWFDKVIVKEKKKTVRLQYKVFAAPITAEDLQAVQEISDNIGKYSEVYSEQDAKDTLKFLKDAYQKERELISRTGSPFPQDLASNLAAVEEYALAGIEDAINEQTQKMTMFNFTRDVLALIPYEIRKESKNVDDMVARAREYNEDLGQRLYEMDRVQLESFYGSMKEVQNSNSISKMETVAERIQKNSERNRKINDAIVSKLTDARIRMVQMREVRAAKNTERQGRLNVARMVNLVDRKRIKDLDKTMEISEKTYLKDIYKAQSKAADAGAKENARMLRSKIRETKKYKTMLLKVESLRKRVQASTKTGATYYVEYARKLLEIFDEYQFSSLSDRSIEKLNDVYDMIYNNEAISDELKAWYKDNLPRLSQKSLREMGYEELAGFYSMMSALAEKGAYELAQIESMNEEERQRRITLLIEGTKNIDPKKSKDTTRRGMTKNAISKALKRTGIDFLSPVAVADKFDGNMMYKGQNVAMVKLMQKGEQRWFADLLGATEELKTRITEIHPVFTRQEEIYLSLIARSQEESDGAVKDLMKQLGVSIIPSQVGTLTIDNAEMILDVVEDIQEKYQISSKLKAIYEARTNKPFPLKKHYYAPLKYTDRVVESLDADLEALQNYSSYGSQVNEGFSISRIEDVNLEVRSDLLSLITEGWNHSFYYINMQPRLDNVQSVVGSKEFKNSAGEIVSTWWKEYLTSVANKGRGTGGTLDAVLRALRQNFQVAILGFKLSTVVIQPTAGINAMLTANVMYDAKTAASIGVELSKAYLNPWYVSNILSESEALILRKGSAGSGDFAEMNKMLQTGMADLEGNASKIKNGLTKAGMFMLQEVDMRTAAAVRQGVYNVLIKKGVSKEKASADADFFMTLTQSSTQIVDRPLILSRYGEIGRIFLTFQTFTLGLWSMMTSTIIKNGIIKGTPMVKMKAVVALIGIPFFTAFMGEMARMLSMFLSQKDDDETMADKLQNAIDNSLIEFIAMVPFMGSIIKGKVVYNRDYGVPVLTTLLDTIGGVQGLIEAKDYDDFIKNGMELIKSGGILSGIPGTLQGIDIANGIIKTESEKKKIETRAAARAYMDSGEVDIDRYVYQVISKLHTEDEIKKMKPETKTAIENAILEEVVRLGNNKDAKIIMKLTKNEDKAKYLREYKNNPTTSSSFSDLVEYLKKYKILSEEGELLIYKDA